MWHNLLSKQWCQYIRQVVILLWYLTFQKKINKLTTGKKYIQRDQRFGLGVGLQYNHWFVSFFFTQTKNRKHCSFATFLWFIFINCLNRTIRWYEKFRPPWSFLNLFIYESFDVYFYFKMTYRKIQWYLKSERKFVGFTEIVQ